MSKPVFGGTRVWWVVFLAAGWNLFGAAAWGQDFPREYHERMWSVSVRSVSPSFFDVQIVEFSPVHLPLIVRALGLDEAQQAEVARLMKALERLLGEAQRLADEYETEWRRADLLRERMADDPEYRQFWTDLKSYRRTLFVRFEQRLKALLREDQLAKWPAYEALKNEWKWRYKSNLKDRRIDAMLIVGHALVGRELPPGVDDVLEEYSLEKQRLVTRLDEIEQTHLRNLKGVAREKVQAEYDRFGKERDALAVEWPVLTTRTIEKLKPLLSEEEWNLVRGEYLLHAASEGMEIRSSSADVGQALKLIETLTDVSDEQRADIQAALDDARRKVREAREVRYREMREAKGNPDAVPSSYDSEQKREKAELSAARDTMNRLRQILTEDQRKRLGWPFWAEKTETPWEVAP